MVFFGCSVVCWAFFVVFYFCFVLQITCIFVGFPDIKAALPYASPTLWELFFYIETGSESFSEYSSSNMKTEKQSWLGKITRRKKKKKKKIQFSFFARKNYSL